MIKFTLLFQAAIIAISALLTGCATTSSSDDPLEGYNRAMYSFNNFADRAVVKPTAKLYNAVTPDPISQGISNFFSNLNDITVIVNDLLQFKFAQAADDFGRFALNSTVGVAGIFDIAGHAGYKKHNEDFGQTLATWGVGSGAYVVLPFIGPNTVRDSVGLLGDFATDPVVHINNTGRRNTLLVTRTIDIRAGLLGTKRVLDQAALDEYSFVRDAYLQRRQNLIFDGNPPDSDFDPFADDY